MGNQQAKKYQQTVEFEENQGSQPPPDQFNKNKQNVQNLSQIFENKKSSSMSIKDLNRSMSNNLNPKKKLTSNIRLQGLSNFILLKQQGIGNPTSPIKNVINQLPQNNNLVEALVQAIVKKYNFRLTINDFSTPLLAAIFKKDQSQIKHRLKDLNDQLDQQKSQYEMTLGFWLAIHLETIEVCTFMIQRVPFLKKIVGSILKKGQDNKMLSHISRGNSRVNTKQDTKVGNGKRKNSDSQQIEPLIGMKIKKDKLLNEFDNENNDELLTPTEIVQEKSTKIEQKSISTIKKKQQLSKEAVSSDLSNLIPTEVQVNTEAANSLFENFSDITELIEVKTILRNEFPTLMTNLLRVALKNEETKVSQVIIAYYKTSVTKDIILRAIENDQLDFMYYMFGFGKNFIYNQKTRKSKQLTFMKLFKYIREIKQNSDEFKDAIKEICEWKLQHSGDNFLQALLTFGQDDLAIQYMGSFGHNLNEQLLIFCIESQNLKFLKEDQVVEKLLFYLNQGTRTNYILDIMSLIDISVGRNRQIKDIMDVFVEFAESNYEKNQLNLSYNPILTIVMSCEILNKVSSVRRKFENESKRIVQQLLRLGEMYISKTTDEKQYEKLILDKDIQDRPVLKIISKNNFERLMDENDPKAENLMNKIWRGNEATNCDGNIFGFSNMSNIVFKPFKKLLYSKQNGIMEIASNSFEPNFKVDYIIQHRYRSKSIYFYFTKELYCALMMLIIFQWLNYQYLTLISIANDVIEVSATDDTAVTGVIGGTLRYLQSLLEQSLKDQQEELSDLQKSGNIIYNLGIVSYLFSFALLFQLFLKFIFNHYSKSKLPFDKWVILDSLSAVLNIIAVQVIERVRLDQLLDGNFKDVMDYFMIFVLAFSWIRFFMYFLVVRSISKLLLTLIEMVEDTISFFFIVSCFIVIMSSIFTTLYQDISPEKFGSLTTTVRTLFDAALAVYSYDGLGGRTLSYSVLMIFHVFFSNVLLLNYLIAILSTTYENMKQSGIFKYKKNLYQYCERFITCFEEPAYGELVLHPPPLSYGCIILLPFVRNRRKMLKLSRLFSMVMFWIENCIFIPFFILFEIIMIPLAYLKTALSILLFIDSGVFRKIFVLAIWLTFGFFIDFYLVYKDIQNVIHILLHPKGFQQNIWQQFQDDTLPIETQIDLLNLARDSVISLFKTLKRHFKGDSPSREAKRQRRSEQKRLSKFQKDPLNLKPNSNGASLGNEHSLMDYDDDESRPDDKTSKPGKLKHEAKVVENAGMEFPEDKSSQMSVDLSDEDSDIENFVIEDELFELEQSMSYNPNDQNCLYVVKKSAIVEDWKIRRKLQLDSKRNFKNQNSLRGNINGDTKQTKSIRAYSLFVPNEDQNLIKEEIKRDDDDESQIDRGLQSKINDKFGQGRRSRFVPVDNLLNLINRKRKNQDQTQNNQPKLIQNISKTQNLDKQGSQNPASEFEIDPSPQELKCINQFFNNFVIVSESSLSEHIDIVMFLRALPDRINAENIHKVKLFNFKIFQESLIAFQNLDLVNPFEYFDEKNRERVQQVKERLSEQRNNLEQVRDIVKFVKRKMYNHEGVMRNDEHKLTDMQSLSQSRSLKKKQTYSNQGATPISSRVGPLSKIHGSSQNLNNNLIQIQSQMNSNRLNIKGSLSPIPVTNQFFEKQTPAFEETKSKFSQGFSNN
ncbi:UNKNOWN [Stylonychia lemnae]|uniref:Ion transport domain-containing protein n=1 Tax=Stylonychia lemnae TaxID=5949 RepID=A0A078A0T0_STYLE|nr:UNKNOWN [Stylonychia lemnae]|eukprot:CDW75745.1 UNKNOWN [Stylonychia lemnae]